jgi:hypothetical protein
MSWASRRKTTRVEDMAYSLTGLFNVHMPDLYGEGKHAFIRLREENIKAVEDKTILAWKDAFATSWTYVGLLARFLANFDHYAVFFPAIGRLLLRVCQESGRGKATLETKLKPL